MYYNLHIYRKHGKYLGISKNDSHKLNIKKCS